MDAGGGTGAVLVDLEDESRRADVLPEALVADERLLPLGKLLPESGDDRVAVGGGQRPGEVRRAELVVALGLDPLVELGVVDLGDVEMYSGDVETSATATVCSRSVRVKQDHAPLRVVNDQEWRELCRTYRLAYQPERQPTLRPRADSFLTRCRRARVPKYLSEPMSGEPPPW